MRENLKGWRMTRVESSATLGFPDVLVAKGGRFVLVELKVLPTGNRPLISPHQVAFHMSHGDLPVYMLVSVGEGRGRSLFLYPGLDVLKLSTEGVRACAPKLEVPDSPEGWIQVANAL
jgi:hypothetical protein